LLSIKRICLELYLIASTGFLAVAFRRAKAHHKKVRGMANGVILSINEGMVLINFSPCFFAIPEGIAVFLGLNAGDTLEWQIDRYTRRTRSHRSESLKSVQRNSTCIEMLFPAKG
jgi:hypothetical protein